MRLIGPLRGRPTCIGELLGSNLPAMAKNATHEVAPGDPYPAGEPLKNEVGASGLSQRRLAALADVSRETLRRALDGERRPGNASTKKLWNAIQKYQTPAWPLQDQRAVFRDEPSLRGLAEAKLLDAKLSRCDLSAVAGELESTSLLVRTIYEARLQVASAVTDALRYATPRDDAFGLKRLSDSILEQGICWVTENAIRHYEIRKPNLMPLHRARIEHEIGKLHLVLGTIERTRSSLDSQSAQEHRYRATRHFGMADSSFIEAQAAKMKLGLSAWESIPSRMKQLEVILEREILSAQNASAKSFERIATSLHSMHAEIEKIPDDHLRANLRGNCHFQIAKSLYCLGRLRRTAARAAFDPITTAFVEELGSARSIKLAEGDAEGLWWADTLECLMQIVLARRSSSAALSSRSMELLVATLASEARERRFTLRSLVILVWLQREIQRFLPNANEIFIAANLSYHGKNEDHFSQTN